jgi:RNA polymerase sigma factor (sigma-70 family)
MGVSSRGLFGFLAGLGKPPAADTDADLLGRFVRAADQHAFAGIVHRHGPMVLAVCRRRLRAEADAEDAFQAVFLALARSAASIGRRESLPGWLYRVAYLISLKAAGRRGRHPVAALPEAEVAMPDPPIPPCEAADLKAVLDAELAGLPDRFRSVVVLCLIEGRTSGEAAAALGVPVGTVDSRLSTARRRLREALTRRGLAVGAGVALEQALGGPVSAAGPEFLALASTTVRAVLAEAAGPGAGAVAPAVADLARGVTTMTTKMRLLAAFGLALGLVGGVGAGVYYATAADPQQPEKPEKAAAKAADLPEVPGAPAQAKAKDPEKADAAAAAALDRPFGLKIGGQAIPLKELLEQIEDQTDLVLRVDVAAFRRLGAADAGEGTDVKVFLQQIYDTAVLLPRRAEKLPVRDVLADALAQIGIPHPCTYQIRGSQLVIVPAYVPPVRPGVDPLAADDLSSPMLDEKRLTEQIYGGVVHVSAERKPLGEVLADLRKQTGANIVLDPRCETGDKKPTVTITLSDVRLYDALRVIADLAELKMVYAGNIYYVTTPANAKTFMPPKPPPPQFGGPFAPGLGSPPGAPGVAPAPGK